MRTGLGQSPRLVEAGLSLESAGDHGVSETQYLHAPDGSALELCWDRPRDDWPKGDDGRLSVYTAPLDLQSRLAAAGVAAG